MNIEELAQASAKAKRHQLQHHREPPEIFTMTPMQAAIAEKKLNEVKDGWNYGYFLRPIRQQSQQMYKPGLKNQEKKTFAEEQGAILLHFYKQMEFVKNKISKNEYHCLMTLEQLRRNPLSKYFMAQPDPLYLKLYDYNKVIKEKLDLRLIASKLLRGKYPTKDDFEIDMVKMIQNFRIYFINDLQLFDISIQFEHLFWSFYSNEQIHRQAIQIYKFLKKKCTPLRARKHKSYSVGKRKDIIKEFNQIQQRSKILIVNKLVERLEKDNRGDKIDREKIDMKNLRNSDLEFIQQLMDELRGSEPRRSKSAEKREAVQRNVFKRVEELDIDEILKLERQQRMMDEIYYSQDQEDEPRRRVNRLEEMKAAVANMKQPTFNSDDD